MKKAYVIVDRYSKSVELIALNRADAEEMVMSLCYECALGQFNGLLRLNWDLNESLKFSHSHQMNRFYIEEFTLI